MQAHNNNIEEFLGAPKTVFVVPVYQRNYDWKNDNCKQLFHDIIGIVDSGREHFLGIICFKVYSSHERSIIDGQQRLTSITLMLKAIYDFDQDEDNRDEINDQYLYNKGRGIDNDFLKYKLHLNKRDDAVYHILLDNDKDEVENRLTLTQKNSRIYQNYLLFGELIAEYAAKGGRWEIFSRRFVVLRLLSWRFNRRIRRRYLRALILRDLTSQMLTCSETIS